MKKFLSLVLFILFCASAFAQKIAIFEITGYDSDGKTIPSLKKVSGDIEKVLNDMWFNNQISFESISSQKTGMVTSTFDALRACRLNNIQYALYGYVKMSDVNYFAEIKIYDSINEKILYTVFETDDLKNYNRLIKNTSEKIAEYFINRLEIKSQKQLEEEKHALQFDLPFSVNYWAPLDEKWTKVLIGVIGVNAGVDFYPEFNVLIKKNRKIDFNFRFDLAYKYGVGSPEYYSANYHSVQITAPVFMNYHLNEENCLSIGAGPLYQFNYAQIQRKYEMPSAYITNEAGVAVFFSYYYKLTEKWKLTFELEGDLYFTQNSFFVLKPKIGAVWNFYKRNKTSSTNLEEM